jgi:hypothetical protein
MSWRRPPRRKHYAKPTACHLSSYTREEFNALNKREPPAELIKDISNDLKKFQNTLQNSDICKTDISAVISLLLKVSKGLNLEDDIRSKSINILSEVLSERCSNFQNQLKIFVGGISSQFLQDPNKHVTILSEFFEVLLERLPDASWGFIPLDECSSTVETLVDSGVIDGDKYLSRMKHLVELRQAKKDEHHVKIVQAKSVAAAAKRTWDNKEYRSLQILPQWEEISKADRPHQLRPNIVQEGESYEDWMHYFDIQFRLLREDFISPLREGINDYLNGKVGRELRNVKVFQNVTIVRPIFTRAGLCHEIKFDTRPFKGYRWEHSKRLIFGSLLCLSPDHFHKKIYFATVSNRDPRKLPRGYLEVMFQGSADLLAHMKLRTEFIMVESMAYFEASRHILRSLQEAEGIETFTKYIISNDCKVVRHPLYLDSSERASTYDIQFIMKPQCRNHRIHHPFAMVPIKIDSQWPNVNKTDLDESQLAAIKMALTQEIAVIQGPPGTGKTYIGLKIVQALLKNCHAWNAPSPLLDQLGRQVRRLSTAKSPILIMCYTNHALDQFLEGILAMNENIRMIRIGGRSQNEKIQECNLGAVKRSLRNVPKDEYIRMKRLSEKAENEGENCSRGMETYYDPENKFIPLSNLRCIINDHHYWSLLESAETHQEEKWAMELWLGLRRKEVIIEYETVAVQAPDPDQARNSPPSESSDDESSSEYYTADESDDEDSRTSPEESVEDIETANIIGEANIEEDARMIDEVSEMFEEMKFSRRENVNPKQQTAEVTVQVETHRTIDIIQCRGHYRLKKYILRQSAMHEDDVSEVRNVNSLPIRDRYCLYKHWHNRYRAYLLEELERECQHFNSLCEEADKVRKYNDRYALDTADVIGMTTTGAAKYQHVLEIVKPKIVVVEEAAEVLESHIVSALNTGTQHLILIGDHKQLRPSPNDYELAIRYKLEISLFERLVTNGFPHVTLQIQHRMRPQIADLVRGHIYDTLHDHESVLDYPSIKGVAKNMFFIQHSEPERASDLSKSNQHEAQYLAALCKFLLQQGYLPSQITILVTYTGQLLLMKNFMPRETFEGVRVTTVDNFQGEENDIILLSLVRSNDRDKIGFLKANNRVCVALSRAKHGFYCIGNFELLRKNADIWDGIISAMTSKHSIGERLSVHCNNHPDYKYDIKYANEFEKYLPTGGCQRSCEYRLPCGHVCGRKCHSDDPDHEKYQCKKPCTKICESCGHPCNLVCYQECRCTTRVQKPMPSCGHLQEMLCCQDPNEVNRCYAKCEKSSPYCGHTLELFCYQDPERVRCKKQCERTCPEGHPCPLICSQGCSPCQVKGIAKLPCGHEQEKYCHEEASNLECQSRCEKRCSYGHACPQKCHEDCGQCTEVVPKSLPCGHSKRMKCFQSPSAAKCKEAVTKTFPCDHTVTVKCFEASTVQCKEEVSITLPCTHNIKVRCSEKADAKCYLPCMKILRCRHKCKLACSELCSTGKCCEPVEVNLRCKHKAMIPCHQKWNFTYLIKCTQPCEKKLSCYHRCANACGEPCTKDCQVEGITHTCPQGHELIRRCFETPERFPCTRKCRKKLPCGHPCQKPCHEECGTECNVHVLSKSYPCGHKHSLACSAPIEDHPCDYYCKAPLACGHVCKGRCSECWSTRIHKPCEYHISQSHYCGETIQMNCVGLRNCHILTSKNPKVLHCMHKAVPYKCSSENFKCTEQCSWECPHHKCTKLCHEQCNRPPCNKRCPNIMKCGRHQCIGLCGEPCVDTCHECDAEAFTSLLQSPGGYSARKAYTQLPCGHIFTVEDMDRHTDPIPNSVVGPLQCPKCSAPLHCSHRYGNKMKEALSHVHNLKTKIDALQMNPSAEKQEKLKRICSLQTIAFSEAPGVVKRSLNIPAKLLQTKVEGPLPVKGDESFLLFLLANVLQFALSSAKPVGVYQSMLSSLVNLIRVQNARLSFQTILDLTSEVYRLCVITKLSLCQQGVRCPMFMKKYEHPHSRILKDAFLFQSKLLDLKLPNTERSSVLKAPILESSEDFIRNMECFYPIIMSGCWMKCSLNHYYCIPVCKPGNLRAQCSECPCKRTPITANRKAIPLTSVSTRVIQVVFWTVHQGQRKME